MQEPFAHKKSLGQHFLNSDYVPKKMCDAANLTPGETVLEIGPGTGALTKELLQRGVTVIAIEADVRALESLAVTFADEIAEHRLVLHHHDARTIDPAHFGLTHGTYMVVANIPYYISGLLFRTLLENTIQPNTLVFLVQKEVAERIVRSKKESLLSLSVKAFGDPTYICTVSRGHFTPPPAVASAVIGIFNISRQRLSGINESLFFEVLHLGFGQKRKQLLGNLSARFDREHILAGFTKLSLSPTVRAEDIPLETWVALVGHLETVS
jgi:16S rRNA (adenine1518-N6/adenine1519-N6)-dimethyltransferase